MLRTILLVPRRDESHATAWPRVGASAVHRGRAHRRARHSCASVRWFCLSAAAADLRPRAVPSTDRWRSLAWSNALHACLRGCGAFPRAQTHRLVSWATSPGAYPAAPAGAFLSLAWCSPFETEVNVILFRRPLELRRGGMPC